MIHLAGTWYNEWGSQLDLSVDEAGHLAGTYVTGVGNPKESFSVVGLADRCTYDNSRSLGFIVAWNNEHIDMRSVTTWSGQYQRIDEHEMLTMTWLMTRETDLEHAWLSTFVGTDVFQREKPQDYLAQREQQRPAPHPV